MLACEYRKMKPTWESQVWNYFSIAGQNFFKTMARQMITMKAKHFLIMCGRYSRKRKPVITLENQKIVQMFNFRRLDIPSPKPKQGIKLSSSRGAKVFPMIEMAFSYGLGVSPMACKLRLLNETLPSIIKLTHWLPRYAN